MKKNSGFTLVEILVVITIITILSALILTGYQGGRSQFALQRAANKLVQDIRRAQEMAMSAKEFKGSSSKGGYGIYLTTATPDRYILFADCNGNSRYDLGDWPEGSCAASTQETGSIYPEKFGPDIEMEMGVEISSLSPASPLTITFIPPDPTITVNQSTSTSAQITLHLKATPFQTRTITVNPAGLISLQ